MLKIKYTNIFFIAIAGWAALLHPSKAEESTLKLYLSELVLIKSQSNNITTSVLRNDYLADLTRRSLTKSSSTSFANPDCDLLDNPRSVACVGSYQGKEPQNGFERAIVTAATIFVSEGQQIINDPTIWAQKKGTVWAIAAGNKKINEELRKIPFLTQTTVGVDWTVEAQPSLYLDSFMKLATLGKDKEGAPIGLVFAQARYSGALDIRGSTINLGLGSRYRIGDDAMIGVNSFWDYRIVGYTDPYSRIGVGLEGFWKDLEVRTNGYISASGTRILSSTATSTTYERVVPGWDLSFSYRVPSYPQLSIYAKGFVWDYVSRTDNSGIGGGINWQISPHLNLDISASNEIPAYLLSVPTSQNNNLYAGISFKYTFQPVFYGKREYKKNIITAMTQPVKRRYDVLLERYSVNKSDGSFVMQVSGS